MPHHNIQTIPQRIPIFPLAGGLLLPRGTLPLHIFEPRYIEMVSQAMRGDKIIGMIQPKSSDFQDLYAVGCAGEITSFRRLGDHRQILSLTGLCRFRLARTLAPQETGQTPYRQIIADYAPYARDLEALSEEDQKMDRENLLDAVRRYLKRHHMQADWNAIHRTPNEMLVTTLAIISPYGVREKQAMLEAETLRERCDLLVSFTEMALAEGSPPEAGRDLWGEDVSIQ